MQKMTLMRCEVGILFVALMGAMLVSVGVALYGPVEDFWGEIIVCAIVGILVGIIVGIIVVA